MTATYAEQCARCGHSHSFDGPLKPLKEAATPCWKCGCSDYAADEPSVVALQGTQTDD